MTRVDLSDSLAAEMDKVLNSEENKQMFSSSSVLEKLAFNRVADEGKVPSEVEDELAKQGLLKTAGSSCKCEKKHGSDKKCDCPKDCKCRMSKSAAEIVDSLLKVSEDLEETGFDKLAALSIVLAEKLVAEAKEKSKSKSSKEEKSSKSKSSKKKMTMKERMKKMREMQKGKKDKKGKSSKKSYLEVELLKRGQPVSHEPPPTSLKPDSPKPVHLSEVDTVLNALPANLKHIKLVQTGPDTFSVHPGQAVNAVTSVVSRLQNSNPPQLPWQKKYHVVPA
jgi:hypothetical protein